MPDLDRTYRLAALRVQDRHVVIRLPGDPDGLAVGKDPDPFRLPADLDRGTNLSAREIHNGCGAGVLVRYEERRPVLAEVEVLRIGSSRQHTRHLPGGGIHFRDSVLGLVRLQLLTLR